MPPVIQMAERVPAVEPLARPGVRRLLQALARPRATAVACIIVLTAAGWAYAALHVVPALIAGEAARLGPGMGLVARAGEAGLGDFLAAFCAPLASTAGGWPEGALLLAMWLAMTCAMMLPAAGPMLLTYADIAETAAGKGEQVVSPLVLAAGYALVWAGFAVLAAAFSLGLRSLALLDGNLVLASRPLAGLVFVAAGAYQFSGLKHACLRACQRPFPFFFAHWTETTAGVFRLGLRQGLSCLGCCWAAMLVMFAAGLMNVVWMALLGVVMTIEKMTSTGRFSRAIGVAFILVGAGFLLAGGLPTALQ